jgi:hypothetical protein
MFVALSVKSIVLISLSGLFLGILLLLTMLKLIKQNPKTALVITASWMIVYVIIFFVFPMISEGLWQRLFLQKPIGAALISAIEYPFFNNLSIAAQCQTKIFKIEIFFYLMWLAYFVAGIGLLRLKKWALNLAVYTAELAIIFSFGLLLFDGICLDLILPNFPFGIFTSFYYSLSSVFSNVLPLGLPAFVFWFILTRDEIKALIENKKRVVK